MTVMAVQAASIDSIIYNKVRVSTPNVNDASFNRYSSRLGKWGARHAKRVHKNHLHTVVNQKYSVKAGGRTHTLKPFADFMALKWGTKFEHLESKQFVSGAGGWSWSVLTASIGVRTGDYVDMRTAYGWSQAATKQQKKGVRYKHCKRRWFRKKCKWRTKYVNRGLVTSEVNLINMGMLKYSHQGAMSRMPKALFATQDGTETEEDLDMGLKFADLGAGFKESNILYSIPQSQIGSAGATLCNGTSTPTLMRNLAGYARSPRNGTFYHSSRLGTFRYTLTWNARARTFTVMASV